MAIISILPARNYPAVDSANIVFRISAIVALKLILATRTWAIWGRNCKILWYLVVFALATEVFTVYIIAKNIAANSVRPPITPSLLDLCNTTFGDIPDTFIVPYALTIVYETVILSLSLLGIAKWRRGVPQDLRTPLLNTLWKDGVLYFMFMLLLSILNIFIILRSTAPQIRTAGANLQTVLHSAAATRLVTHLSNKGNPRVITDGVSISGLRFTSHLSGNRGDIDSLPVSEISYFEEDKDGHG
ncbi:hypothetical protein L218DRAFT_957835 [Marasmius fiardii PR-910]|nr:hypothetical protein L218DRAFT_957835 [Marasmius fiardii PR-910]